MNNYKYSKLDNFPSSGGIEPVNLLLSKYLFKIKKNKF